MKLRCKVCDGTGRVTNTSFNPSVPDFGCWHCDGAGVIVEWAEAPHGSCLSTSDLDSDPVCVSNLRVWAETHAETEDTLWRMRHGGYGSRWVELREGLDAIEKGDAKYKRAERLGLTGLTAIVDDLHRLSQYPILDEDDESEAEREEQEEHWKSYGRSDVERAVRRASDGNEYESVCAKLDDMSSADFDALYWNVCQAVGWYPERIDSSAWDFGHEARWGREPRIVAPMLAAIRAMQ